MRPVHIVVALLLASPRLFAGPASSPQENTYDFGVAKQGTQIVHAFSITNNGASPLTIKDVELSMPGMKARFKPIVNPGAEGSVTVEWDTTHLTGEIEGQALVHFADNSQSIPTLRLKGVVKPPLEVLPFPAIFISAFQGENNERHSTIVNNEAEPVTVTLSNPGSQRMTASLVTVQPGRTYELVTKIAPGTLPGRYDEELSISTDNPQIGMVRLPVHLFVKADLYANPDSVDFGRVSADQLNDSARRSFLTQTFLVKKREGNFEITKITSDVPGIEISQDPAHQKSSSYRIDVALDPRKVGPGELEGSLEIYTSDRDFPHIKVPVTGYVF
jgi:hypothetical protein